MNVHIKKILAQMLFETAQTKNKKDVFFPDNIKNWKNKHFDTLAITHINIDDKIVKRIFNLQGYDDCINTLTRIQDRQKVALFLGFDTWETLENILIVKASGEILTMLCK